MGHLQRHVFIAGLVFIIASIDHINAHIVTRDSTNSSTGKNPLTGDFVNFVKDNMDYWKIPGMAIAVVDGQDVFSEGYGYSALPDTKVTTNTLFYVGSTTKAQTAACLSALIHNGSYEALAHNWSTTISSILGDDFVLQDQWATNHITLDDAVSHRTGFPRHDLSLMRERHGVPLSPRDIVRNMRNLPFPNEPRTKLMYTNYMYITLSHVIETVTKKGLKDVVKELIWEPLGMDSTYFGLEQAKKVPAKQLATGYIWNNDTGNHIQTVYMPVTDISGAAAVISNVHDYARWIQALLNETRLFSESVYQDMKTPRMIETPIPGPKNDISLYGLGWYRTTFRGHVVYRHDGVMIGFKAQIYLLPDDGFGFVMLANGDNSDKAALPDLSWALIAQKFKIPQNELVNVTASRQTKGPKELFDDAVNALYPDRPKDPPDPSFSLNDMEGLYSDEGYGKMMLHVDASKPGKKVLIAERAEMTWHYGLTFRHVFGDNWIACSAWLEDMDHPGVFSPAEFLKGDDRRPSALRVKWISATGDFEGNVTFKAARNNATTRFMQTYSNISAPPSVNAALLTRSSVSIAAVAAVVWLL